MNSWKSDGFESGFEYQFGLKIFRFRFRLKRIRMESDSDGFGFKVLVLTVQIIVYHSSTYFSW